MLRITLRVAAVLFLLGGLASTAIAGYFLFTPSDEEVLYEQKHKEMKEKHEKAQTTKDPVEKARLLKESEEAAGGAKAWGEGTRVRRASTQIATGLGVGVIFVSFLVFLLTFVGRKAASTA